MQASLIKSGAKNDCLSSDNAVFMGETSRTPTKCALILCACQLKVYISGVFLLLLFVFALTLLEEPCFLLNTS